MKHQNYLLKHASILTMRDGPQLVPGDIYISGGKIAGICPSAEAGDVRRISEGSTAGITALTEAGETHRLTAGNCDGIHALPGTPEASLTAEVIDCTGLTVMPGLIDCHVHYDEAWMGDFFLAAGVTSVRNMRGYTEHARWREEILKGTRRGPYIYSSGPVYDGEDPTIPENDNEILHTREDVGAAIRYVRDNGFLWMKTYPMIDPELYRYLLARCQEEHLPVCGHMTKRMSHTYLASHGYVCCEHTSSLPGDPGEIEKLARLGMWLCPTHVVCETLPDYVWNGKQLESVEHYADLPAFVQKTWAHDNQVTCENYRKYNVHPDFNQIIERAVTFLRYSDRVLAGTDCAYQGIVPGFAMWDELDRLVHTYGMTAYSALEAATSRAAAFIGNADEKGSLFTGADADLLVLAGNPLEDIHAVRQVRHVFQGGTHFDEDTLQQRLNAVRIVTEEETERIPCYMGKAKRGENL